MHAWTSHLLRPQKQPPSCHIPLPCHFLLAAADAAAPLLPQILAYVSRVQDIDCQVDHSSFTLADVESNIARCPDQEAAQKMIDGARLLRGPWRCR